MLQVKDAVGTTKQVKTTISGTEHIAHHIIDSSGLPSGAATSVKQAPSSTVVTGQQTITTSAVQLNSGTSVTVKHKLLVKALSTNSGITYVGPSGVSATTGYALQAGDSVELDVDNVNKLYAIGTASDKLTWMANS